MNEYNSRPFVIAKLNLLYAQADLSEIFVGYNQQELWDTSFLQTLPRQVRGEQISLGSELGSRTLSFMG